jgi:heptaprenyl diphosphate synthase
LPTGLRITLSSDSKSSMSSIIGMAFQMIDDILDFESDESVMRKPVGKDIAEGLCTLPLVYALEADPAGMRAALAPLAERSSAVPAEERSRMALAAAAMVARLGGVERARSEAGRYTDRALREIGRLPGCAARDELAALARRLLLRSY